MKVEGQGLLPHGGEVALHTYRIPCENTIRVKSEKALEVPGCGVKRCF